jgi:multiple antibiotic resistance protein
MNVFVDAFLLTFAALFPIVNPVGNAPLFLGLTQFSTPAERNVLAWHVSVNSFFLLLGALVIGSPVLEFFGISLPVVRIGGGLVVAAFGWSLLNSGHSPDGDAAASHTKAPDAFYPLTLPLTVGPGSISVAITLGSQRPQLAEMPELLVLFSAALAGIVAITTVIYICYRFADRIVARLGSAGTSVVMRLSAFILLCIGIQILWGGVSELIATLR